MKKLALKACQVQELNVKQMQEQDGGVSLCCIIIGVIISVEVVVLYDLYNAAAGNHSFWAVGPFSPVAMGGGIVPAAVLRLRYRNIAA